MLHYNLPNVYYQSTGSPIHLLQAYLAQIASTVLTPVPQFPLSTVLQPQSQANQMKQPSVRTMVS